MTFNGSIDIGQILTLAAMLLGGFYFVWEIKGKLNLLIQETTMRHDSNVKEFTDIKTQLSELSKVAIELAKQEIRMNTIDQRMLEISTRVHSLTEKAVGKRKVS